MIDHNQGNDREFDPNDYTTVIVDIFELYIFLRNSHFLNVPENMHTSKITCLL